MPRYGRKKVIRSRPYRKARGRKRIARVAKGIFNRMVETKEIKYTHSNVGSSNFASCSYGSGAVVAGLFGAIASGTGSATRIGQKITARGVRVFSRCLRVIPRTIYVLLLFLLSLAYLFSPVSQHPLYRWCFLTPRQVPPSGLLLLIPIDLECITIAPSSLPLTPQMAQLLLSSPASSS